MQAMNMSVTETDARADLKKVVEDLKQRAQEFAQTNGGGKAAQHAEIVTNKSGVTVLNVGGRHFMVGHSVTIHSKLSAQVCLSTRLRAILCV